MVKKFTKIYQKKEQNHKICCMRKKQWVLVLDSGIGGQWTLLELEKVLPKENFLFFMDKTNAPYGNKSKLELCNIVTKNVEKAKKFFDIKLIVLACNTISAVCYDELCKKFFDTPIVKIHPFCDAKKFFGNPTLVLATQNTAKYSVELAKMAKQNKNVYVKSFATLAKKIDDANGKFDELLPYLKTQLEPFCNLGIKNIVLGCTHYNFLKSQLVQIFGDVKFFENSTIVANQARDILERIGKLSTQKNGETIIFSKLPNKKFSN